MRRVCEAVSKPVIMAGSIDREERVIAAAEAGAAGFTVGTAALKEAFPAETAGFAAQVRALLEITDPRAEPFDGATAPGHRRT